VEKKALDIFTKYRNSNYSENNIAVRKKHSEIDLLVSKVMATQNSMKLKIQGSK
jgi:hypothetical protein